MPFSILIVLLAEKSSLSTRNVFHRCPPLRSSVLFADAAVSNLANGRISEGIRAAKALLRRGGGFISNEEENPEEFTKYGYEKI